MKKTVVIAGNGPSLAEIDYRRLPKNYDVFRVNNFYFEEKYFLGKEVTHFIVSCSLLKHQFYNIYQLNKQKEYNIENITCFHYEDSWGKIPQKMYNTFPYVNWVRSRYIGHKIVDDILSYYSFYYRKYPTTGSIALLEAIKQGYTDIYITGMDLYDSQTPYTFTRETPNYYQHYAQNVSPEDLSKGLGIVQHSREMEEELIKACSLIEGINIYSISTNSSINKLLALAPIQNENSFVIEEKTDNHIMDWLITPLSKSEQQPKENTGFIQKIKQLFQKKGLLVEWEQLRTNIFFNVLKDFIQGIFILIKFIIKKAG